MIEARATGGGRLKSFLGKLKPKTKKGWIITSVIFVIVVLAVIFLIIKLTSSDASATKPTTKDKVVHAPAEKTVASNLTGLQVDPSINNKPVTAVMIENSLDARPQSGLSQAGVVFEAIAEGGVTRFMALYQDNTPSNIGPVRSSRPYYLSWALGFDAAYAHVGGSPDALQDIKDWDVKDLDQFYNGDYYHRIDSRDSPHNVYTGVDTLNKLEAAKGYSASQYTPLARATISGKPAKTPDATTVDLTMSGSTYNPHYDYDSKTNSYNRSEGGATQTDDNTGKQISPKVVVAMVVPLGQGQLDASGAYYSDYQVIGSGTVYIFQNGTVQQGTWTKSANTSQIVFTDANGAPILLSPGQTWITAVAAQNDVSYSAPKASTQ